MKAPSTLMTTVGRLENILYSNMAIRWNYVMSRLQLANKCQSYSR